MPASERTVEQVRLAPDRCDPAALPALAAFARRFSAVHGRLRLVATSEAVSATLDSVDLCDVLDRYRAHDGA
ncbi:hypothetical protein ACVGOW_18875 [Pseudonocardia saturnea]